MLSAKVFNIITVKCQTVCKMAIRTIIFYKTSLTPPFSIKKSLKIPT